MSVRIKNPSMEIQRAYTPLNLSTEEIHLVVKRYSDGELSKYLHVLTPGVATVWVNQGFKEWEYKEGQWDHVVFVAGGTGITPAFQLCLIALQRQKFFPSGRRTRLSVLAATKSPATILLREDFMDMKRNHGGLLDVKYFVDSVPKGSTLPEDVFQGPITEKVIRDTICPPTKGLLGWRSRKGLVVPHEKTLVLVCGPDQFTRYIAGPHGSVKSKQGPKGGLLNNVEGIEVFKMLETRDEDHVDNLHRQRGMRVMKAD